MLSFMFKIKKVNLKLQETVVASTCNLANEFLQTSFFLKCKYKCFDEENILKSGAYPVKS